MKIQATLPGQTTQVIAASGRLLNEHFLLTADYLLLEVDTASLELVAARAEGNIQMHMRSCADDVEYVIFAQEAVYEPHDRRVMLQGWQGTRENGVDHPPSRSEREVSLPTDGTFYFPQMSEAAEKRLPLGQTLRQAA